MPERTFRMVLPKYDNSGRRISTDILRDISRNIASRFEGISVIPSMLGCYAPPEGGDMECEENIILEATRSGPDTTVDLLKKDVEFFAAAAKEAGVLLGQEEIYIQEETDVITTKVGGHRKQQLPKKLLEADFFKKLIS
jgi:hypothetical protein|tara:strand:+ start:1664 stop:2080 length:417 start_codon:yes stop_codon:yes gene_type:complete